jgi:precorrin-3B synthase
MIAAAEAFLAERDAQEWRIAELEDGENRILSRLNLEPTEDLPTTSTTVAAGQRGSALVVSVPLGSLTQEQAAVLIEVAEEIRITPWRSVVLPGVSAGLLEGVGLVTTANSVWEGVTACAGRPGCGKALADVRADAWQAMPGMIRNGRRVHWSGCERRCGKPAGEFVDVLAVGNGYLMDGERM